MSPQDHDKKNKDAGNSSNIEDFFAQFDEISSKLENKPEAEPTSENNQQPSEVPPVVDAVTDLQQPSRRERLSSDEKADWKSVLMERLILILAVIKGFFLKIGAYTVLDRNDSESADAGVNMPRNTKRKKQKKYRLNWKKLLRFVIGLILLMVIAVGAFTASVIIRSPKIDPNNIYSLLSESSLMYDSEGNIIDSVVMGGTSRTNVSFNKLPEDLVDAFVAIEDKTFWEHKGFNIIRIFGAIKESVFSGGKISGTSTITQQLARNLYLVETKSNYDITRKISEAYYTIQLEQNLEKEQIIEAYLNTIFLGYNSNGVQAASQAYFSKDVENLTLIECAALSALAKAPDSYALVKRMDSETVTPDNENIIYKGDSYTYVFNDLSKDRRELALRFMEEQGYITPAEKEEALAINFRDMINPSMESMSEISSYFADYVISQVLADLQEEMNLTPEEARSTLYNNGLRIYTTMDSRAQKIVETEYDNPANFPGVTNLRKDGAGNIVKSTGGVILYAYPNYFDENGTFTLFPEEFRVKENGDILLLANKRLHFYKTQVQGKTDYSIEFKNLYQVVDNRFYSMNGGVIMIPQEYKDKDGDGNLVISSRFLTENPEFLTISGDTIQITNQHYTLRQKVIQPQSAMVITEPATGAIRAMVGGRETFGRLLFNRATSPRQPGSSMKPIGVYGPAIQQGADAAKSGTPQSFNGETSALYGDYWTAASVIDDSPLTIDGKLWPTNWYTGYRGLNSMRVSIEQSINVNAVKVFQEVGVPYSVSFLKKLGITSLVESGATNDMNAAALALGGMTKGVSPLEMAGAYGAFVNQGLYTEPVAYTRVENKRGEVILEKIPFKAQAMDKETAFIMTDMLKSTVQSGIGASAAIGSQPVAGKTGTTSDNYDAWFVGFTPQYVGSIWIGNDVNIELTQGSVASSRLFSKIMKQVCAGLPTGSFPGPTDKIVTVSIDSVSGLLPGDFTALDPRNTIRNEYFIAGTQPTRTDNLRTAVRICSETGFLATPECTFTAEKVGILRPYFITGVADITFEVPHYYCPLHNSNPSVYAVDPSGAPTYFFEGVVLTQDNYPGQGNNGNYPGNNGNGQGNNGNGQNPADDEGTLPDWLTP